LEDVIKEIPLERMVLETDAPFLAPVPYRGKRNEPAFIRYTAEKLSEIKGLTSSDICQVTTRNAMNFFGIAIKC